MQGLLSAAQSLEASHALPLLGLLNAILFWRYERLPWEEVDVQLTEAEVLDELSFGRP